MTKQPEPNKQLVQAFVGPAAHSNRFYIIVQPSGLRIAFMEAFKPMVEPVFRSAVLMSYEDALALRDLLTRQLATVTPKTEH